MSTPDNEDQYVNSLIHLKKMNEQKCVFFCQLEPDDPDDGDPGFTARPKCVVKPKSHRGRAKSKNQQSLSCKHCRKTFTKLQQLKAHQTVHSANVEKPFHCSQCDRGFSFQRSLNAHMLLHTGECSAFCLDFSQHLTLWERSV